MKGLNNYVNGLSRSFVQIVTFDVINRLLNLKNISLHVIKSTPKFLINFDWYTFSCTIYPHAWMKQQEIAMHELNDY